MLAKLKKITSTQAAVIILVFGLAVFFTGLTNPFQGDDFLQIVNNIPVHSLSHVKLFFDGGTFYGGGSANQPLIGVYYRPIMTTVFSFLYTLFGSHVFYYHFVQLLLYVSNAVLLYLILKHFFKSTAVPLALSLVFLVHPLNSQVVFAIPSMQDVLFMFFGLFGIYKLVTYKSNRDLWLVALFLFLSMLSKETGIFFTALGLFYLFWWGRKKLLSFAAIMVAPTLLWLVLKIHAVGLSANPGNAPIDRLKLGGRLLTSPSIIEFYITKFIFPWKLASAYYWVHPTFSLRYVLFPLLIDLAVLGMGVYVGFVVWRKAKKALFHEYLFFAVWALLGLLSISQMVPLDMTASETWFYFPMAGILGMVGVVLVTFKKKIDMRWLLAIMSVIVILLGGRSLARGTDWSSSYKLDKLDISSSKQDYVAYNDLSHFLLGEGKYAKSEPYATASIQIFPYFGNYNNLGVAMLSLRDFSGAKLAFDQGLKYGNYVDLNENLAEIAIFYGNINSNRLYFNNALQKYPYNGELWYYLAIFDDETGDNNGAKVAINYAIKYGYGVSQILYNTIIANKNVTVHTTLGTINLS